jgi:prepilin-type N-terminal cleavage/methylation domain-containing protein
MSAGGGWARAAARGFTLVEVILVIAIVVLTFAIAIPTVGRSLKSARLKTAAREAVVLSRYARNASILHQKHHVLLFHPDARKLELVALEQTGFQGGTGDPFATLERSRTLEDRLDEAEASATYAIQDGAVRRRQFPEGVLLTDFEGAAQDQEHNGVFWVTYYPNGMCDDHAFSVGDTRGRRVTIRVAGISGEITVGQNW